MNLLRRVYRDPGMESGGGVDTAPTPVSNQGPQIVTPQSYGGGSQYQDWQDPYQDPAFQAAHGTTQPASDGKTPQGPAILGEGVGTEGQTKPDGLTLDPTNTTAKAGDDQSAAEKTKGALLSEEDRKHWETKDPAYKDLPNHPAVAKMSSGYRELESQFTRNQQYLGVVNQTIDDYRAVLQNGDLAEIAKMVEHFGGEVKFDTRTPEKVIAEAEAGYASIFHALQAVQHELPTEAVPVLNKVLAQLYDGVQSKTNEITQNQKIRAQVEVLAKAAGIQPTIGNPNERYKAPAQANITSLEREFNDPNFWAYYDEIKSAFALGGVFHAQGVTAGKAFGASVDSARYYMNLAKGQWLSKNMQSKVLPEYEKSWMAKQAGNGAITPPPRGAGAVTASQPLNNILAGHALAMDQHMKRRSGA